MDRVAVAGMLGVVVAATGCGGAAPTSVRVPAPATAAPTSEPTPTASPRGELLVAVLERRGGVQTANRLAIVGLDGYARASAMFTPHTLPDAGGATLVLQPEARLAGGGVDYVDGAGVVRRLVVGGGPPRTVATFPVTTSQQVVAFAVSPDGSRLMATVLTVPPPGTPQPWHVDVEVATPGGPTVTVRSIDVPAPKPGTPPHALQVTGWDESGPVGIPDGVAAGVPQLGFGLWPGHPAHLDSRGFAGPPMGGPGCGLSFEEPDGTLLCEDLTAAVTDLRKPGGGLVHRFTGTGPGPRLSPDGRRLAYRLPGGGGAAVQAWDGTVTPLPVGFTPTGWLRDTDVIGTVAHGELVHIDLSAPAATVSLGFPGDFVGTLHGPG